MNCWRPPRPPAGRATRGARRGRRPGSAHRSRRRARGRGRRAPRGAATAAPTRRGRSQLRLPPAGERDRDQRREGERGGDQERGAERVRRGGVDLVLDPSLAAPPSRPARRIARQRLERRGDDRDLVALGLDLLGDPVGEVELGAGSRCASSSAAVPAASASARSVSRSAVNTGVSTSRPATTPAWREAIVQPPWIACGARPPGPPR